MSTLTDLYLNFVHSPTPDWSGEPWLMSPDNVVELVERSPNLRQLALRLPTINLPYETGSDTSAVWQTLDSLLFSSKINVLRILHWPVFYNDKRNKDTVDSSSTRKANVFACKIIHRITQDVRSSALQLMVIGEPRCAGPWNRLPRDEMLSLERSCACFLRTTQTNPFGKKVQIALPVPVEEVKHEYAFWDAITTSSGYIDHRLGAADYSLLGRT